MPSVAVARRAARTLSLLSRSARYRTVATASNPSSSATNTDTGVKDHEPNFNLPQEKLRGLISLCHEASTYVTRETLEERIIDTFINRTTVLEDVTGAHKSYSTLRGDVARRDGEPRMYMQTEFQDRMSQQRLKRVFGALYGTADGYLPGLELMLESWDTIEQRLAQDTVEQDSRKILEDVVFTQMGTKLAQVAGKKKRKGGREPQKKTVA
ncbi:hypothetical protein K488DRAFT_73953 [Vararia minispora EC-137]|uniref:Uncharacterized protein n=1 Tax=Vararia minispora EC-137 TaxID=1314806 RepID=A0ACB8Q918_9AGAM|nr:hypothetical protein K488DRAFT_73953 [Vararia minispora EC-137]